MLKKIQSLFSVTVLLPILASVIALSWVWSTVAILQRNFEFQRQVDSLRQEVSLLELQNKTIEYQIEYYKTSEFAELAARDNLNKINEGEKVLILPPSKFEDQVAANKTDQALSENRSNFQQWMYFLFERNSQ